MSGRSKNGGSENLAKDARLGDVRGELDPPEEYAEVSDGEDEPKKRQGRDVIPDPKRPAEGDENDSDDEDEPEVQTAQMKRKGIEHPADLQYIYGRIPAPQVKDEADSAVNVSLPMWCYDEEEEYQRDVDYDSLTPAEKARYTKGRKAWLAELWKSRQAKSAPPPAILKAEGITVREMFMRGKRLVEWSQKTEAERKVYRDKWEAKVREERDQKRRAAAEAAAAAAAAADAASAEPPKKKGVTALPKRELVPVEDENEGEKEKEESEQEPEPVKPVVGPIRGKGKTSLGPVSGHGKSPAMPPDLMAQQQAAREKEEEKKRKKEAADAEKARKKEQSKQLADNAREERARQAAERKREREEAKARKEGTGKGKEMPRGKEEVEEDEARAKEGVSDDEVEGKGKTGSGFGLGKEGSGKEAVKPSRRRGRGKEEPVDEDDDRGETDARRGGPADEKVESLTHAAIRRIARRAGCKRISNTAFEPMQNAGKRWMEKMLREAVAVMECYLPERRTVSSFDILYVLRRQNQRLFGFWERPGSKPLYNLPDD